MTREQETDVAWILTLLQEMPQDSLIRAVEAGENTMEDLDAAAKRLGDAVGIDVGFL